MFVLYAIFVMVMIYLQINLKLKLLFFLSVFCMFSPSWHTMITCHIGIESLEAHNIHFTLRRIHLPQPLSELVASHRSQPQHKKLSHHAFAPRDRPAIAASSERAAAMEPPCFFHQWSWGTVRARVLDSNRPIHRGCLFITFSELRRLNLSTSPGRAGSLSLRAGS
jgi:hypothetical protein